MVTLPSPEAITSVDLARHRPTLQVEVQIYFKEAYGPDKTMLGLLLWLRFNSLEDALKALSHRSDIVERLLEYI
jgi:hypothetical protein